MKNLAGTFFILLFLSLSLLANEDKDSFNNNRLKTELRFTNRAQCALDSKKPAENILVLLSNMDVGRSLYRLGKVRGERDISEFTKLGLSKYRYTVLSLLEIIHKKIVNNQLPLLPSDLSSGAGGLSQYKNISASCLSNKRCPELEAYLNKIWQQSSANQPNFKSIDSFSNSHFLTIQSDKKNKSGDLSLICSYLKKFTPLEAHLFGTKPTVDVLEQIGNSVKNVDQYYSSCHNYSEQESLKVSTYEFSFPFFEQSKTFEQKGFDYWNSLKIYFSWAFRNAPEAAQLSYPFDEVFSSVLIEDSLFMVPNGCKSVANPKCDPQTINQNSMRLFAKHDFKKVASDIDFFRSIPDGASKALLEDQFAVVNKDLLNFSQFETADLWADNFRQNFSETRLTMRKKFVNSMSNLSLITSNLKTQNIRESLYKHFYPVLVNKELNDIKLKSELYYLCAESTFISSEELSYIRPKIDILSKLKSLDTSTMSINSQSVINVFDFYKEFTKGVNELCGSFDQSVVFDPQFKIDQTGFNRWYVDTVYEGKIVSIANLLRKEKLLTKKPMIAYQLFKSSNDLKDVVCIDVADCARTAIGAIVDLYSVVQYAEIFLDIKNEISSGNLLNPYAERTACKVYDPWFKTKASLFSFMTDAAQGAIAAVSPGVIYGSFDLEPGKVASFSQLVKDGKITINSKYNKNKILSSVALDLGSMTHVPCSISMTKSKQLNPSQLLTFTGLTIRACKADEKNVLNVDVNNEFGQPTQQYYNGCIQCSLEFEELSSVLSSAIPFGRTAFFMARAMIRLYKGLKDPVNVPKSWSVNPYLVNQSLESHGGKFPNDCVNKLISGKSCMKNSCEENIINAYLDKGVLLTSINSSDAWRGEAEVQLKGCSQKTKIKVNFTRDQNDQESCYVNQRNLNLECKAGQ